MTEHHDVGLSGSLSPRSKASPEGDGSLPQGSSPSPSTFAVGDRITFIGHPGVVVSEPYRDGGANTLRVDLDMDESKPIKGVPVILLKLVESHPVPKPPPWNAFDQMMRKIKFDPLPPGSVEDAEDNEDLMWRPFVIVNGERMSPREFMRKFHQEDV